MKFPRLIGLLLVSAIAPAAVAKDAFELAGHAPKDALMVLTWVGADAVSGEFEKTYYAELFNDPDVNVFLSSPTVGLWRAMMDDIVQAGGRTKADAIAGLLGQAWRNPGMICVVKATPTEEWPATMAIAAEWRIDDPGNTLRNQFKTWMQAEFGDDSGKIKFGNVTYRRLCEDAPLYLAVRKRSWIIALGAPAAEAMAKKRSGPRSFAVTKRHTRAVSAMGEIKPWFYYSIDVDRVFDQAMDGFAAAVKLRGERKAKAISMMALTSALTAGPGLVASGLTMFGSGELSVGCVFDEKFVHAAVCARPADQGTWASDYVGSKAVDVGRLSVVPADADSFTLCSFDALRMFNETTKTLRDRWSEAIEKCDAKGPSSDVQGLIEEQLGFDLPTDLFGHLGQQFLIYTMKNGSEWLCAIDIKNRGAVEDVLIKTLNGFSMHIGFTSEEWEGLKLLNISIKNPFQYMVSAPMLMKIKPCCSVSDTRLVFGSHSDHVKQYFRRIKEGASEGEQANAHPVVKPFLEEHKDKQFGMICWQDEGKLFGPVHQALGMSGYLFAELTAHRTFPVNAMYPPPPHKFADHMAPTMTWIELKDGMRVRHSRTSATISTGSIVAALVTANVLMHPSMSRHAEQSNRAICLSNMQEIGGAMYRYADAHDGTFPSSFETLIETGDISPWLFTCPSSDADYEDIHACYAYISGITTKSEPSLVLMYEINEPHDNEGSNVLFQDGHVEWVAPYSRVLELVEQTKKKLAAAD